MIRIRTALLPFAAALTLGSLFTAPTVQAQTRHIHRVRATDSDPSGYRPLTIGRHSAYGPIIYRPNEVYAPGGFSAHGYGPGNLGSDEARRAWENADVRRRTNGLYGSGWDGIGGTELYGDHGESGYNNPNWGNSFNTYVGYNGVPTALAFGPAYAGRYIADHEPEFDNHEDDWPSPQELGYQRASDRGDEPGIEVPN